MKKIPCTLLCVLFSNVFYAQWNTSSTDIYYTGGKVGIGTSSPSTNLDVQNSSVSTLRVKSTGSSAELILARGSISSSYASQLTFIGGSTSEWALGTSQGSAAVSDWSIFNYNKYMNALTISSGSNYLGVGTTTPAQQLDVNGWMRVQGDGGNNRENSGGIEFFNNVGASSNVQAQIRGLRGIDNWKSGQLAFYTAAPGGTLNERMTIVENGYTGIGTSSPAQQLDVNGWMRVRGDGGANRDNSGGIEFYNNVGASSNVQAQIRTLRGINNWKSGQLAFYTAAAGGTLNEQMTITENGSIGIGTTEPSEKLSVNGNVRARKIIVTQSGWSDYVFEKNYRLRDLTSLEAYIQQYKHLPEVPSANEVEEKGISVGDNQALLLKKIEELTLYIIELKKEAAKQQQEINEMKRSQKKSKMTK